MVLCVCFITLLCDLFLMMPCTSIFKTRISFFFLVHGDVLSAISLHLHPFCYTTLSVSRHTIHSCTVSYRTLHTVLYLIAPYRTVPYCTVQYHTIPFINLIQLILSYPILSYLILSYLILFYLILSYLILSYPALPHLAFPHCVPRMQRREGF